MNPVSQTPDASALDQINKMLPNHKHNTTQAPEEAKLGFSSPVVSQGLLAARMEATAKRMAPWMIEFQKNMPELPVDTFSNAEPKKAVTTHLVWDVEKPDFDQKVLHAKATYTFKNLEEGNGFLSMDVNSLDIHEVTVNGEKADYTVIPQKGEKPNGLKIAIPGQKGTGTVSIRYSTQPDSTGLFWVDKAFTEGKKEPLLYTLFQPSEGASVIPGQHSPQIRMTYEVNANLESSELMALSSVSNNPTKRSSDGKYEGLRMGRAVPLYLLSLHVGNFTFRPYEDGRSGVYSEEAMIDESHNALQQLPAFINAAEEICGPYNWGTYTPIILGWAFPYMAMEHPCASTCGSVCMEQPYVIPHELAHSWTGNDITNCDWKQFFWNEGWTTYVEYLITEKIWGTDYASMVFLFTLQECKEAMDEFREKNPELLKLCMGKDDTEFTRIPYAKGALFFFMLREAIGKESFEQFTQDYMKVFYQNTMSDERFLQFLSLWLKYNKGIEDFAQFREEHQIDAWLYEMEIPANCPVFESKLMEAIEEETEKVLSGKPVNQVLISSWDVATQLSFLSTLEGKVTKEQLQELDEQMGYTTCGSMSLLGEWSLLCAMTQYFTKDSKQVIEEFVIKRNSMHQANQISLALAKSEEGRGVIRSILDNNNGQLFPLVREKIGKNLAAAVQI